MNKKVYDELSQVYSLEELAENFVFPHDLTDKEKKEADEELKKLRFELLKNQTEEERIFSDLIRVRIKMEDFSNERGFNENQGRGFAYFLKEYMRIIKRNNKEFAKDLGIHPTRLSRILNDREEPNIEVCYRLEKHSGKLISALLWWKLLILKQEYLIRKDMKTREFEESKVRNELRFRA